MKKTFMLLSLLLILTLFACKSTSKENTTTNQGISTTTATTTANNNVSLVEAALADLKLTGLDNVTSRITLPGKGLHNVTITWESDKPTYITDKGVVTQPAHTEGNQVVTLTATLKLGDVTRTKEFKATVIALDNPANAEPSLVEKFNYPVNDYLDDHNTWQVTKGGRTGQIVDKVPGNNLPTDKVIKFIENSTSDTHYERSIDVTDITVFEFMFLQENEGAGVNLEFLNGTNRVFSVSTNRNNSFVYRNPDGNEHTLSDKKIKPGIWYKARVEIDVNNAKYKFFHYDYSTGGLVELTPTGGVSFPAGQTSVNMLRIRVKNAPIKDAATYFTDFVVNKVEALAPKVGTNPNRAIGLGDITGVPTTVNLTTIETFTESIPVVKNRFNNTTLVKDTDYTLSVDLGNLNTEVAGTYNVKYTITNKHHSDDVKEIVQTVKVVSYVAPNNINSAKATLINAEGKVTLTFNFSKVEGTLYYVILPAGSDEPTREEIKDSEHAYSKKVEETTITFEQSIEPLSDIYAIVFSDNGYSNVFSLLNIDTVNHIKTAEQFNDMANSGSSASYVLDNDIDFTDFEWTPANTKFKGTFDGKGFTISNLIIKTTAYGGIFNEIEGATIKNLVIRNMQVNQPGRGGLIAGQAIKSNIENIKIYNSKVTAVGDSYSALLVGRLKTETSNISNIYVEDSEVYSEGNRVGGLVGMLEANGSILNISDIYLNNLKATEVNSSVQLVGGIIGRVNDQSTANINRVFIKIELTGGTNIGGIIGKKESASVINITDAVVSGKLASVSNYSATIVGNGASNATNVWDAGVFGTKTSGQNVDEEHKVTLETISNDTWWETNVPSIFNSSLWEMVEGLPRLK